MLPARGDHDGPYLASATARVHTRRNYQHDTCEEEARGVEPIHPLRFQLSLESGQVLKCLLRRCERSINRIHNTSGQGTVMFRCIHHSSLVGNNTTVQRAALPWGETLPATPQARVRQKP